MFNREYMDRDGAYLLKEEPKSYLDKFSQSLVKQDYEERPWYMASVYTKHPEGLERAYEDACKMTIMLEENDIFTFSPIVHSHGPAKYAHDEKNALSHDFWLTIDFKYVKLSRGLLVVKMTNWEQSFGIAKEIEFAKAIKKPIIYTNFMEIPREFLDERYTT